MMNEPADVQILRCSRCQMSVEYPKDWVVKGDELCISCLCIPDPCSHPELEGSGTVIRRLKDGGIWLSSIQLYTCLSCTQKLLRSSTGRWAVYRTAEARAWIQNDGPRYGGDPV